MITENEAANIIDLRIAHFVDDRIGDPRGRTQLFWKDFHYARNQIIDVCREFGTVGPMDIFPLDEGLSKDEAQKLWKTSTHDYNPDFFVVDDQLNNERYIYVEINKHLGLSCDWIIAIARRLALIQGWGIGISNVSNGYIIILDNIILVHGAIFDACKDIKTIVKIARENLR